MTPVQALMLGLSLLYEGAELVKAVNRVANGIAAKAEREGRAVTDDEMALIEGLQKAAIEDLEKSL